MYYLKCLEINVLSLNVYNRCIKKISKNKVEELIDVLIKLLLQDTIKELVDFYGKSEKSLSKSRKKGKEFYENQESQSLMSDLHIRKIVTEETRKLIKQSRE